MAPTPFRLDPARAAWRLVDGRVLVVSRATGRLFRLDRAGTAVWQALAAASPEPVGAGTLAELVTLPPGSPSPVEDIGSFLWELEREGLLESSDASYSTKKILTGAGSAGGRTTRAPRSLWITDPSELSLEIEAVPSALAQRAGDGFLLRSPSGDLELLTGDAALVWRLVSSAPRTFPEILDALCERFGRSYHDTVGIAALLIGRWNAAGMIRGLEQVAPMNRTVDVTKLFGGGARALGRLDLMRLAAEPSRPPLLGAAPTLRDTGAAVEHVAIVCQYGIHGLAPGVEPYTRRCIARLRALRPDLVILSGGGRHGGSDLREAESVIDRYRALLPGPALWVEKHSATTWENLQHSLELLLARSIVPRRVTLLGDRARTEKLRLACWLAKRRFTELRGVAFRVVPVRRPRFTWKDSRWVQIVVGTAQVVHESRGARLATAMGPAVAGEGSA